MNVIAKLKSIPTVAKICVALAVAAVLGIAVYLVVGPEAAGAVGLGGVVASLLGVVRGRQRQPPEAVDLAEEKLEQTRRDVARETSEAESRGRVAVDEHAAILEDRATDTARDRDLGATLRALGRESGSPED